MLKKLILWSALLLSILLNFTAVANGPNSPGGRWYYEGDVGKWRFATVWNADEYPLDYLRSRWLQDPDDHHWYYLDRDGWMLTGVQELDGIRYHFRDQAHQGNYFPDAADTMQTDLRGSGFYFYRSNGRPTYGSLMEILSEPDHDKGSNGSELSHSTSLSEETDAQKEQTSTIPKPAPERSSASDLPKSDPKASASDIRPTGPTEENERRQELEEDAQIHGHTDRDEGHCIAYDLWSRILQHPLDYEDCFENRCTSRLYLTGTAHLPEAANAAVPAQIPLYVSLLRAPAESEGRLELVQAYAADALSLPMHIGMDVDGGDFRGNVGGAGETLPWALLNGGTYHWTDMDGITQTENYAGYRLCSKETDGFLRLPLEETAQYGTGGFREECRDANDLWRYLDWRDADFDGNGNDIGFLVRTKGEFHFLSEQNLFETAAASVPLPRNRAAFYPAAADSWRSADPYWLSSTPCYGIWVTDREALLDEDELDPYLPGAVPDLAYDDHGAGRHYLLYDDGAALDDALFTDPAKAARPVGSAEATESRMLRIRFTLKTKA